MKQDFASIGKELRQKRVEKNLSLKEIQNATSIQYTHLEAIEAGDMSKLISPVYAQGFLKQYAKFLGIDGEQFVRENAELFAVREKQHFDYGIGTVEKRVTPGSTMKGVPNLVWITAFLALLVATFAMARYFEVL